MSIRFGMSMTFLSLAKLLRTRKLLWITVDMWSLPRKRSRREDGPLPPAGDAGPGLRLLARSNANRRTRPCLLDLDVAAGFLQLGRDFLGLGLGHAGLDVLGGALDQVLGVLQAQAGELAHHLDDLDLLVTGALEDHG